MQIHAKFDRKYFSLNNLYFQLTKFIEKIIQQFGFLSYILGINNEMYKLLKFSSNDEYGGNAPKKLIKEIFLISQY